MLAFLVIADHVADSLHFAVFKEAFELEPLVIDLGPWPEWLVLEDVARVNGVVLFVDLVLLVFNSFVGLQNKIRIQIRYIPKSYLRFFGRRFA